MLPRVFYTLESTIIINQKLYSVINQTFLIMKIVYVAKFYDGANWSYIVSGAPTIFGTKKKAREYIRANVSKELKRNYLRDLRNA